MAGLQNKLINQHKKTNLSLRTYVLRYQGSSIKHLSDIFGMSEFDMTLKLHTNKLIKFTKGHGRWTLGHAAFLVAGIAGGYHKKAGLARSLQFTPPYISNKTTKYKLEIMDRKQDLRINGPDIFEAETNFIKGYIQRPYNSKNTSLIAVLLAYLLRIKGERGLKSFMRYEFRDRVMEWYLVNLEAAIVIGNAHA